MKKTFHPDQATQVSSSISDIPESTWKNLSEKRIYFGHQSVGYNIIEGLKDIMKENPMIKLNIIETNDPHKLTTPIFAHSRIGNNTEPGSKSEEFSMLMKQGIGNKADFALFKLCYVDITADTEVQKVFANYKNIMANLKKTYPKTKFIHVTVPLTTVQTGFKALVKKIIGRPITGYVDNINRNQFNDMLRKEYNGKEPIFDLAGIESTFPDGRRASFMKDGKNFYSLVPEYTYDGGHLNEEGRKRVARQLLLFLANLSEADRARSD